ncbi:MAG: hypothetical protein JWP29_4736 [Rhodoferax sp.]|nr:hypothetical protein [Rhodoferax sp.]
MPRFAFRVLSSLLLAVSATVSITAHAAPVGLGIAGDFNLFSLKNVTVSGGNIQGAVAAAGNLTSSNNSINNGKDAYAGNAVVVGGNLTAKGGSINNGNGYVGGTTSLSSFGFSGKWTGGTSPVVFADQAAQLKQLSTSLAGLATTGSSAIQWGGMAFLGSDSAVEIFDISGSDLASVNWSSMSHLAANSTVILNISGKTAGLQGGLTNGFANYNVLFNFFEATTLNFSNVEVFGSVLAPLATVTGGSGQIDGNVVVGDWNSNLTLSNSRDFDTIEVKQFALPAAASAGRDVAQAVPEPAGFALFATALALLAWSSRQKPARRQVL